MAARLETASANISEAWTAGRRGWLVLWSGWLLPQLVLIGPALIGWTVFSPVDILASPNFYLPATAQYARVVPRDIILSDLLTVSPAARDFCAQEFSAGRLPLWQPANAAGLPFATWPKYSLFEVPYYLLPRPITLAWMQLLETLWCGGGMWLFLRHTLRLSFWPAAIGSWCFPLIGFLSLWQGFPVAGPVSWFGWLLFLVSGAITRPWGWSSLALAIATALLIYCGQSDITGLVLLTTGLYVVWKLGTAQFLHGSWTQTVSAASTIALAWLLGFLLAAPYLLPLVEHIGAGSRMHQRAAGKEERPPAGLRALPAVVLPEIDGSTRSGSHRLDTFTLPESSASAYAGLLTALWLAPLAWCDRQRRGETLFWTSLACLSLGWVLNVPGIVQLERLWPLNMLSYSRWTWATGTAIVILSAIGIERLLAGPVRFRWWFALPMLVVLGLGLWCFSAAVVLPEPLYSKLKLDDNQVVRRGFTFYYACGVLWSLLTLGCWGTTFLGGKQKLWHRVALAVVVVGELVWFAGDQYRQASPDLYFPRIPALETLAQLPPGRIWGFDCFPPNLNQSHGLKDIRSYDAVDPAAFVRLLDLARDTAYEVPPYALTQMAVPRITIANDRIKLSPVASLLNVRYVIFRSRPPSGQRIIAQSDDYWIVENHDCLPRFFVPPSAHRVADEEAALRIMASADFDPAADVLMTENLELPRVMAGTVTLRSESPLHLELEADMATDGLIVVADVWDAGWQAQIDGEASVIHRVDYALRGIRVPVGRHTLTLSYQPLSVRRGFQIAGASSLVALAWTACLVAASLKRRSVGSAKQSDLPQPQSIQDGS